MNDFFFYMGVFSSCWFGIGMICSTYLFYNRYDDFVLDDWFVKIGILFISSCFGPLIGLLIKKNEDEFEDENAFDDRFEDGFYDMTFEDIRPSGDSINANSFIIPSKSIDWKQGF